MDIADFEDGPSHGRWMGVTERTLRRYCELPDGGLPFVKRGGRRLYCRPWTLQWLEDRKIELNPPRRRRIAA